MTANVEVLSANRPETRLATRLLFFVGGLLMGAWSPIIPYAKLRTGVDDAGLGLVILALGVGSVVFMPLAGGFCLRFGVKRVVTLAGLGLCISYPALAAFSSIPLLVLAVFAVGACLGTLEVGMNSHAVEVERESDMPLMSGFHAQFSIGGFVGAGGMTLLMSGGVSPLSAALFMAAIGIFAVVFAWPRLLETKGASEGETKGFRMPRGVVLLLAVLIAITFLVEGAILDWSALLITEQGLVGIEEGGIGFMVFSIAMTIGRIFGDRFVAAVGGRNTLLWGGLLTIAGLILVITAGQIFVALVGFAAIGFGASNIVPVLFSQAGRQKVMPSSQAIAAVATAGYGGILLGPAGVGFIAEWASLPFAFAGLALLMTVVSLFSKQVTQ